MFVHWYKHATFTVIYRWNLTSWLINGDDCTRLWRVGTQEQCRLALVHIERILRVKSDVLNKPSKHRKTPRHVSPPDIIVIIIITIGTSSCGTHPACEIWVLNKPSKHCKTQRHVSPLLVMHLTDTVDCLGLFVVFVLLFCLICHAN